MIYTTLTRIRKMEPCVEGWRCLRRHLGTQYQREEPFPLVTLLDSNGLSDALWALQAEPQHASLWRLLAVTYAQQVKCWMAHTDSREALEVAARFAVGAATEVELSEARGSADYSYGVESDAYVTKLYRRRPKNGALSSAHAADLAAALVARDAAAAAKSVVCGDASEAVIYASNFVVQVFDQCELVRHYQSSPSDEVLLTERRTVRDSQRRRQAELLREVLTKNTAAPGETCEIIFVPT